MDNNREKIKLGVQLYTLRRYATTFAGLEQCFAFCSKVGAQAVQLSAVYEAEPTALSQLCENHQLEICVTHKSFEDISKDCPALCAEHLVYGCKIIGLSRMPPQFNPANKDEVLAFCDVMNNAQAQARAYGINLAYHNHAFEFKHNIYDVLIDNLDKDIKFILDLYWADFAGEDNYILMDKLADRLAVLHLKDHKTIFGKYKLMRAPGKGECDFAKILRYAEANTACKYALIELDVSLNPLKAVENSMKYLIKAYAI